MKTRYVPIIILLTAILSCGGGGGGGGGGSTDIQYWTAIDWQTVNANFYAGYTYDGLAPSCSGAPGTYSSDFRFFYKEGSVDKLLVFFQGGGACWHGSNCLDTSTYSEELQLYDNQSILDIISNGGALTYGPGYGGIFDFTDDRNPFRDWNMVYIPYCTGDLHWGANDASYTTAGSGTQTIHHRGSVNFHLVLQWMIDTFATDPDTVFVTGISAGAYGAIMNFPFIQGAFPSSHFFVLGDAGNGIVNNNFQTVGVLNWDIQAPVSTDILVDDDFTAFDSGNIETLALSDVYAAIANHYTTAKFAQYTAAWDENQSYFFNVMEKIAAANYTEADWNAVSCTTWDSWNNQMNSMVDDTVTGVTTGTYHYFIAPGDVHTILMDADLYQTSSAGVLLVDWINAMLNGTAGFVDVECTGNCGEPAGAVCP
ncbi:MAG: hypothetical protein EPN93_00725 [Spirochaetes bacterium]|nr:MAG: hypothetical protein EPN93_00725 [Spirochaetota bacterium]